MRVLGSESERYYKRDMHVLGIDAGGTKTVGLLADEDGTIVSSARGPGANLQVAGELEVEKVLHHVMDTALDGRHDIWPRAVCLGIAGVDREDDARIVSAIMRRISPGSRVLVVNDALVALEAGAPGSPGIVIICGTGSIAYGRTATGVAARAGGWGHIIGDEGSGYWIGREAVRAVMRQADGRGPATSLTTHVLAHFEIPAASSLVHIVYGPHGGHRSMARLGPSVQKASEAGDAVAAAILDDAARELALAATSVARRLELSADTFPFILAGGVFRVVPGLVERLSERLRDIAPRAAIELLREEPARGAVSLALAEVHGGAVIPKYS
jgi:N-acetylglucosamine kinase-like BadF-type ATPase